MAAKRQSSPRVTPEMAAHIRFLVHRQGLRSYTRWRFCREEHVRAHTRRWPNQYVFSFMT